MVEYYNKEQVFDIIYQLNKQNLFENKKFGEFLEKSRESFKLSNQEQESVEGLVKKFNGLFDHFLTKMDIQRKKVRGLVDGVWDMTHFGHFNAIRQAKSYCDTLVVLVIEDTQLFSLKGFYNKTACVQSI